LSDLFLKEQKVLDDAEQKLAELRNGQDFGIELLETLVAEYGKILSQKRKLVKITDKAAEVLLSEKRSLKEKIAGMEELLQNNMILLHTDKPLRVQCFGNFEVFNGVKPLYFPRKKAKELFAYLVHKRGTSCTTQELIAVLFEDKTERVSLQKQVQTLISVMMKVLREVQADDVIIKEFNSFAVNTVKISCDYYRFLDRDEEAMNQYMGEYMTNYSWAEFMVGYLDSKVF